MAVGQVRAVLTNNCCNNTPTSSRPADIEGPDLLQLRHQEGCTTVKESWSDFDIWQHLSLLNHWPATAACQGAGHGLSCSQVPPAMEGLSAGYCLSMCAGCMLCATAGASATAVSRQHCLEVNSPRLQQQRRCRQRPSRSQTNSMAAYQHIRRDRGGQQTCFSWQQTEKGQQVPHTAKPGCSSSSMASHQHHDGYCSPFAAWDAGDCTERKREAAGTQLHTANLR